MIKGKRLTLSSHHFPTRETAVPWADVWASTTVKPGRTVLTLAPTLLGLSDLENEEDTNKTLKWEPDPDHAAARAAFAAGATHYIGSGVPGKDHMDNIYAPERYITPAIAERLCLAYAQHLGISASRVKWTRSKLFSTPV